MRISPSPSKILLLAVLLPSCSLPFVSGKREKPRKVALSVPPTVLTEMELARIKLLYDNLPDFVAYGTYTVSFLFNRDRGTFRLYKVSDTIYVKMDDDRTYVIRWDSVVCTDIENGRMDFRGDTVVLYWNGNEVKLLDDNLIAYRGKRAILRMEDYSYDPIPHPRRIVLRSMGASVVLVIDSITPLYLRR